MSPEPRRRGRLVAVSVGLPREIEWQGETVRTGIFKSPVDACVSMTVGPKGIEGDGQADLTVHGGIDKAVYSFDEGTTAYWRQALARPDLGPGVFGENLTVVGWPEESVRIGDRFRVGSALFEVSQPRQPCFKLGLRFEDPKLPKRFLASGRVGYYLRVLEPGRIRAGDAFLRVHSDPTSPDIRSLVRLWLDPNACGEALARAIGLDALAEAWRAPLRKRRQRGPTLPS